MNIQSPKRRFVANLSLLAVTAVWGATFTLTKNALDDVPVFSYLAVRFALASVLLALLCLVSPETRRSFQRSTWSHGAVLGLFLFGAYAFQTLGLQTASPSMAGFLTGLSVVLVPMLAKPLLGTKAPPRVWGGAAVALVGLALLCGLDFRGFTTGELEVVICAAFIALQVIYTEKYGSRQNSLALATVEIAFLAVLCALAAIWWPGGTTAPSNWLAPNVLWAVLVCAIPGTALAYWAQNVFQKYTSSAETAIIFSMEPVFAAVIAWLALGDSLGGWQAVGGILIFLSMLISDPSIRWEGSVRLRRQR
jgi:drug/metabolite transporter (DMT)-like permease